MDPTVIEGAARKLVERLDLIHADPAFKAVWTLAYVHNQPYRGPTYEHELRALREALAMPDPGASPGADAAGNPVQPPVKLDSGRLNQSP